MTFLCENSSRHPNLPLLMYTFFARFFTVLILMYKRKQIILRIMLFSTPSPPKTTCLKILLLPNFHVKHSRIPLTHAHRSPASRPLTAMRYSSVTCTTACPPAKSPNYPSGWQRKWAPCKTGASIWGRGAQGVTPLTITGLT